MSDAIGYHRCGVMCRAMILLCDEIRLSIVSRYICSMR